MSEVKIWPLYHRPLYHTEATGRLRDVYVTTEGNVAILMDGKGAELMLVKPE